MAISYFFSDIHLKGNQDPSYNLLITFFKVHWRREPGDIYLLGDIFDLWVSDHQFFISTYRELIELLKIVKNSGYNVTYFEGNHDLHLSKYWQESLGFSVQKDIAYYKIADVTFRIEHGDLINQQDIAYLRLRKFLRTPFMTFLAHQIPGSVWSYLGAKWSHHSRKASQYYRKNNADEIVKMIQCYAESEIKNREFDVLLTGHMHVFDFYNFEYQGKPRVSINLGSWFEQARVLQFKKESDSLSDCFKWVEL